MVALVLALTVLTAGMVVEFGGEHSLHCTYLPDYLKKTSHTWLLSCFDFTIIGTRELIA